MGYGASNNFPTSQRVSVSLLKKYRCKICMKFKGNESFSKKELNSYIFNVQNGRKLNEITANLRCRNCAGDQHAELVCQGPCGTTKDLQCFSKSSRSAGGWKWCQECVLWKEAMEPGVVTQPPPESELAPDEDETQTVPAAADYFADPEAGSDDDYGDWGYGSSRVAPAPAPSSFGLSSISTVGDTKSSTGVGSDYQDVLYKGLSNLTLQSGNDNLKETSTGSYLPPHLRGKSGKMVENADIKSQSSMSNPYEVLSTSPALQDWDNVDARRRQGTPIIFTAYDNTGRPHQKQYAPSTSEYPSGPRPPGPDAVLPIRTVSSSYRTIPAQRSGSGYSQPSPVRPPVDTGRKNGKWAKPVGARTTTTYTAPKRGQGNESSHGSQDTY